MPSPSGYLLSDVAAQPLRPERTHAVVVGVERHSLGPEWTLRGPASDALGFAEWLASRRVPDDQIDLFISPASEATATLSWRDRPIPAAERDPIEGVFLRDLPRRRGDLLFVFWGGHGFFLKGAGRKLFYADATLEHPIYLDLTVLLERLRSDLFPGFEHQIWIVDACANHLSYGRDFRLLTSLPPSGFGPGVEDRGHRQMVLISARRGQWAMNEQGHGLFSLALLKRLKAAPDEPWPPDFEQLAVDLRRYFEGLPPEQTLGQRPTYFSFAGWQDDEPSIWGRAPELPGTEVLRQVLDTLDGLRLEIKAGLLGPQEHVDLSLRGLDDEHIDQLVGQATFAGRRDCLERLDGLTLQGGYHLITAPAGGGKSTLLAHWLKSVRGSNEFRVCYHFFRSQSTTARFDGGLTCLCEQLLATHDLRAVLYEARIDKLGVILKKTLTLPHPIPLVVVLDGLDEAVDFQRPGKFPFEQDLFPNRLGENTTVIFSVRAPEGDETAGWFGERLGIDVNHWHLPELDEAAVRELLGSCRTESLQAKAADPQFVAELTLKTGGLAIYLRYLIDELDNTRCLFRKSLASFLGVPLIRPGWV